MEGIPGGLPSLWPLSADLCFLFVSPGCAQFIPPKSRTLLPVRWDAGPAACRRSFCASRTWSGGSPKTPLLEVNKMDQREARRGKGLAIVSPLGGAEGEKVKGVREEIWREKEEEPAGPPIFPLLSSSSPSLPLFVPPFLFCFFSSLSFLEKVAGQS